MFLLLKKFGLEVFFLKFFERTMEEFGCPRFLVLEKLFGTVSVASNTGLAELVNVATAKKHRFKRLRTRTIFVFGGFSNIIAGPLLIYVSLVK